MEYTEDDSLILVVDDSPTNLEIISNCLRNAGYIFLTAPDGQMALQHVKYKTPDLILLDVIMPGIDGFKTCKALKENPETRDIPVILMTAISDTESKVKGLELGAVDYIIKPFHEQEILARIKTHLQLRNLTKTLEKQVAQRTAELSQALQELQKSQVYLIQKEKMSALGQLVAGVAHEINNPVGSIYGNLGHAAAYCQHIINVIDLYQLYYPAPGSEIEEKMTEIDWEFLRIDLPSLISSMKEGVQRIRNISNSLRVFSRADSEHKVGCNIHECIDSTLLILKHRLKSSDTRPDIEVVKDYGNLPLVECYPGQLNQVFMNILANAIDAIEESIAQKNKADNPKICISTELNPNNTNVSIRIKDNGIGMSPEVQQKAFENLFTTKPVGKGTGLGLAISYEIIVEKHGGTLAIKSEPGKGSEFIISLVINSEY